MTPEYSLGEVYYCNPIFVKITAFIPSPSWYILCSTVDVKALIFSILLTLKKNILKMSWSRARFSHLLDEVIAELSPDELQLLANDADEIGTHSLRKGAATFCLGQVMGPSPVTVYLRMDHSLGKLKDQYIFHGDGADQLCGRILCGLPCSDDRFCVITPHFEK